MHQRGKIKVALDLCTLANLIEGFDSFSEIQKGRVEALVVALEPFVEEASGITEEEVLEYLFQKYCV